MSLNRRTCRPFLVPLQPGKFKYAWISDDILVSALRPFLLTRSRRRHVGLAPGPLEARKRATRRRFMGLAPSEPALPAGDIASQVGIGSWIFGRSRAVPQTYQWQKPSEPIRKQVEEKGIFSMPPSSVSNLTRRLEKTILPSWLTGTDTAREQTPKVYLEDPRLSNSKLLKDATTEYQGELQDAHLQAPSALEHCKSLGDIPGRRPRPRLRRRHKLNSLAIQGLLERDAPLETILEFLEDPVLNARKSNNLRHALIHWVQKQSLKTGEDVVFVNWIQTQVILGFLPFQDISSLLEIINSPNNSGLAALNRELFFAKLIEGVQRCTVCGSMSAKESMLKTIFQFISSGEISPTMVSLGWDIVRTSSRARFGFLNDEIGPFVSNCVLSEMLSQSSTAPVSNVEDNIAVTLKNIRSFPDHLAEAFIQSASKALIMRIKDPNPTISDCKTEETSKRKYSLERFDKWWTSLHDCGMLGKIQERPSWQIVEHALGSLAYDVLASYLRLISQRSKCIFFIRHCFQPKSECENLEQIKFGRYERFRTHIEAQFKDICEEHPDRSPFVNLLIAIRLGDVRRDNIFHELFDMVRTSGLLGTSLILVEALNTARVRLDTRVIIQEIKYYLERKEFRTAYRIFQEFPFVSLEHVPALAEVMIANPNICIRTALHYRDSRQMYVNQVSATHISPQSLTQLRVNLLNGMAIAAARSPHNPSISFREVYRCYCTLKRERLPFTAETTKAMTYAGIVRYLMSGRWVSTAKYNFIWSLVKEVEGQLVADRLDDLVYYWRGRVLNQQMYRKRKERDLGLPYGSPLVRLEIYTAKDPPTAVHTPSMHSRPESQWYNGDWTSHICTPGWSVHTPTLRWRHGHRWSREDWISGLCTPK